MSSQPGDVSQSPSSQIVGQQAAPSSVVPHTPDIPSLPTNRLAVVSVVTGVLSYLAHVLPLIGGGTLALIAIITGWIARKQIARSGEGGKDLATIGIVLGVVNLSITILIIVAILFFVFVLGISMLGIAAHQGG